jgi:hypothetical protein
MLLGLLEVSTMVVIILWSRGIVTAIRACGVLSGRVAPRG